MNATDFSGVKIDTDAGVIIYQSAQWVAQPFTVSGTVITLGSSVNFGAAGSSYGSLCLLDTNKVAFCFGGASGYANARVATVAANILTMGAEVANFLSSYVCMYTSICAISTTKFLVHVNSAGGASSRVSVLSVS